MRRALLSMLFTGGLVTSALAAEPNLDFTKSPCAVRASGFERAIAIRVFPHMAGQSEFYVKDGKTDWRKSFGNLRLGTAFDYIGRAEMDGWAVYQLLSDGFKVQYMFGDFAGQAHDCVAIPDKPEAVAVSEMPTVAVQMYLSRLTGDATGNPGEMRDKLKDVVRAQAALPLPKTQAPPVGKMPNLQFADSPCSSKALDLNQAVAIRIEPAGEPGVTQKYRIMNADGDPWRRILSTPDKDADMKLSRLAVNDGWAVYSTVKKPGEPFKFYERMMFGNFEKGECTLFPAESPWYVAVGDLPVLALQMYVRAFGGDPTADPGTMRKDLEERRQGDPSVVTVIPSPKSGDSTSGSSAQAGQASIDNACGTPVSSALVEIGNHTPPKIFTPETIDGYWQFNYLHEADEPMRAMCFLTKEESSLFRVPLPNGLKRCVFLNGKLSCWNDQGPLAQTSGDRPGEKPVPGSPTGVRPDTSFLPNPVAQEFSDWNRGCLDNENNAQGSFTADYLTVVDIDGDSRDDFILNDDGASCVRDGKQVASGGGNGGTTLRIFMSSNGRAVKVLETFTPGAGVYAYKGYAVVDTGTGVFKLSAGRKIVLETVPKGGRKVYELAR